MSNIWFTADLHLNHEKSLDFSRVDGGRLRPFSTVEEMDQAIIDSINEVVKPDDKLYILGDLAWNHTGFRKLERLNGIKYGVLGNHDQHEPKDYMRVFKKVYGAKAMEETVLTHVPVHPSSLGHRWKVNVHGHLHDMTVKLGTEVASLSSFDDPRYFCVSV